MYGLVLFLHILGATIWTGGHIILVLGVLPQVFKTHSPEYLLNYETMYERIGMSALLIQVITGMWLAYRLLPNVGEWFNLSNPISHVILAKLILLFLTVAFAVDARFRVIPKLSTDNLADMAWHIIPVTLFSILFVLVGVSFRTGWLY